jgi:hypothetical protein
MGFFESPSSDLTSQVLILEMVEGAARIPAAAAQLCR